MACSDGAEASYGAAAALAAGQSIEVEESLLIMQAFRLNGIARVVEGLAVGCMLCAMRYALGAWQRATGKQIYDRRTAVSRTTIHSSPFGAANPIEITSL